MSTETPLPAYTRSQLALRNGQDRDEIWCAYNGLIYDLSTSRLWRNGHHYEHWAGQDLTDELADAPHTNGVFTRFPVVGKLC
ncbi:MULTISPECIES: cytochrome b5 domain-containing protein [unclassified Spirosoma]|uniref:cytochrome b5 domain-containing protein n=1 Tax=unclassified Spirosoma TaxID=2621999 RepID=UPI00095AE5E9|nr:MULTISPECIES: cytochrome b5 domain-containing protein [unclassified Spirosoma]MBN8825918.1 cytochrome b5 [Spirosoma sp.]OJW70602.1 MAG: cytochrome b5 [Spirosoma sp. 48-14]